MSFKRFSGSSPPHLVLAEKIKFFPLLFASAASSAATLIRCAGFRHDEDKIILHLDPAVTTMSASRSAKSSHISEEPGFVANFE